MEPPRGEGASARPDGRLVSRTCEVDGVDPWPLLEGEHPRVVWSTGGGTIVAAGAAARFRAAGPGRFDAVREAAAELFADRDPDAARPARPRLFGGFAFHDGGASPGDAPRDARWAGFPDAEFVLPRVQVTRADGRAWLTVNACGPGELEDRLAAWRDRLTRGSAREPAARPGVAAMRHTPSRAEWREQVEGALAAIERGDLRKVVLAGALSAELATDLRVPDALSRLAETYPRCYRFMFDPGEGGTFFGATPERLVSVRGRTVRTEALAGSTGRGETPEEDEWLAADLLESRKDRHEHDLVVDAVREQLEPFAAAVATGSLGVRRLASVQHLRTPVTAELRRDEHVLSLVEALHPTPAVGGLPPDAALRAIRGTETFGRGWYAAPVGWLDANGDGTFAVAIRSALARGREATLFAGAGIVADSDPEAEWDEVQLKYRPILDELERG